MGNVELCGELHVILSNKGGEVIHTVQLVEALRWKPHYRGFDSPMESVTFSIDLMFPDPVRHWGGLCI